ncbi:MAG: WbuC family cupin fold metalloprotein [Acidiferrobacterales bacterium]
MNNIELIDDALLAGVSRMARESTRGRKNYNFHATDADSSHRLVNAMEPGSYIQPHCHSDPAKDETIIVLRGRLGVVFFDAEGNITAKAVLEPGSATAGVNIAHGVFHSLVALAPGSAFFEAKAGPYLPLTPAEKAGWAPAEGDPAAGAMLARLKQLFEA